MWSVEILFLVEAKLFREFALFLVSAFFFNLPEASFSPSNQSHHRNVQGVEVVRKQPLTAEAGVHGWSKGVRL